MHVINSLLLRLIPRNCYVLLRHALLYVPYLNDNGNYVRNLIESSKLLLWFRRQMDFKHIVHVEKQSSVALFLRRHC